MAKTPQSISSYLTTSRNFVKWVIGSDRTLTQIDGGEIPFDHSPSTGRRLGILVEGESTNHFPDSEFLENNVSLGGDASVGDGKCVISSDGWIGVDGISLTSPFVCVSFFIESSDPVFGYLKNKNASFSLLFNDKQVNVAGSYSEIDGPLADGTYRVRIRGLNVHEEVTSVKIIKTDRHKEESITISKIQIEENVWSSYIPTTNGSSTRSAEYIYRQMEDNVDINPDQGSIHLSVLPTRGTKGTALSILGGDRIDIGGFNGDNKTMNIVSLAAPNIQDLSSSLTTRWSWKADQHFVVTYSGYGVRAFHSIKQKVDKLKNFKIDRSITSIRFGNDNFFGLIKRFRWDAYALNDEDIQNTDIPIITQSAFVFRSDNEAILFMEGNQPPSPETILDTWPRMSDRTVFSNPMDATGASAAWVYDPERNSFVQPNNVPGSEFIMSPFGSSSYSFECILTSNATDDDNIGLIAAFDVIDDEPLFVAVWVHAGGGQGNRFSIRGGNGSNGSYAHNGGMGTVLASNNAISDPGNGWRGRKVKVRIVRNGNQISAMCSDWDDDYLLPSSELTINLSNIAGNTSKLANIPGRYGFCTNSQADSTYLDYKIRAEGIADAGLVYSIGSNSRWVSVDNEWEKRGNPVSDFVYASTLINEVTQERFNVGESTISFTGTEGVEIKEGNVSVGDVSFESITSQFSSPYDLILEGIGLESDGVSCVVSDGSIAVSLDGDSGFFYVILSNGLTGTEYRAAYRKINVNT